MKQISFIFFLTMLQWSAFAQTSQGVFQVLPEKPYPGDEITLIYDAENSILKDAQHLKGRIYTFDDFQWYVSDLEMQPLDGQKWQASFQLSDKASFLSCVFESDTLKDAGVRTSYSWLVMNAPGSHVAWGLLRCAAFDEVPHPVSEDALIGNDVAKFWVNQELHYHPESRLNIFYEGLKLMQLTTEGDQSARIKNEIRWVLGMDLNVFQQDKLQKTLRLLPEEGLFVDSVRQVLITRYPSGVEARDQAILTWFKESDISRKMILYEKYLQQFPEEQFRHIYTKTEALYLEKAFRSLAYSVFIRDKNYQFIFDQLPITSFGNLLDYSWHFISIPLDREMLTPDSLLVLANRIIPELERREQVIPKMYLHTFSPEQWKNKALSMAAREYMSYAMILERTGHYKEERFYLEKIKPVLGINTADFNDLYVRALLRAGEESAAMEHIRASLKANNATPEMLEVLKKSFLTQGGDEAAFEAYLQTIKSSEEMAAHRQRLIDELINEPIEGFDLESIKGGKVNLGEQKGKIVVLDFWATWCAPCKRAMPGMQMVVSKYEADPNVQFYFVDTQEYVKDYRDQVKAFIEEKGYTFNVLFDALNPQSHKPDDTYSKYAAAFHFSGIPQKMIIDQNGRLRWRSTGYGGSPSELADEISMIIEYLKSEEKQG